MPISSQSFTKDLTIAGSFVFDSSFTAANGFQLGQVTFRVDPASVNLNNVGPITDSPISAGIQEPYEIWLKHNAGASYYVPLHKGNFNGAQYLVWAPPSGQNYYINNGSQIRIILPNIHKFGILYGTISVNVF